MGFIADVLHFSDTSNEKPLDRAKPEGTGRFQPTQRLRPVDCDWPKATRSSKVAFKFANILVVVGAQSQSTPSGRGTIGFLKSSAVTMMSFSGFRNFRKAALT